MQGYVWLDSTSRETIGNLPNLKNEKITKLFQILFIVCCHFLHFFLSRFFNEDFLVKWGFTIELGTSTNADLEIYPLNFGLVSQLNWIEIHVLSFKQYWIVTIWTLIFKLEKNPHHLCTSIDTKICFVECHCSPFRMMTYFCSLNSNNMFQVLRNFTSSLETSNASFALNSVDMTALLLGANTRT